MNPILTNIDRSFTNSLDSLRTELQMKLDEKLYTSSDIEIDGDQSFDASIEQRERIKK